MSMRIPTSSPAQSTPGTAFVVATRLLVVWGFVTNAAATDVPPATAEVCCDVSAEVVVVATTAVLVLALVLVLVVVLDTAVLQIDPCSVIPVGHRHATLTESNTAPVWHMQTP